MSYTKWIGAALGWTLGGPIGAIIGMALGSAVDAVKVGGSPFLNQGQGRSQTYTQRQRPQAAQTGSGDFEMSLLILASVVIKADGVQDKRELDFVRNQFVSMYGKERANQAFSLFKNVSQQEIPLRSVCIQIQQMMDHPSRLQLLHFLFGIAKADGMVTEVEVNQIFTISGYLGISNRDFESIKAMFYSSSDTAYKILEITKEATDAEVKLAYRKMAKKYHPDKVAHLGPEHQKGAEEKFKQVREAYEKLQKERGL